MGIDDVVTADIAAPAPGRMPVLFMGHGSPMNAIEARAVESDAGRMVHPTLDHYLPLLYAVGAAGPHDSVRFPIVGFDLSSLSMRSVLLG